MHFTWRCKSRDIHVILGARMDFVATSPAFFSRESERVSERVSEKVSQPGLPFISISRSQLRLHSLPSLARSPSLEDAKKASAGRVRWLVDGSFGVMPLSAAKTSATDLFAGSETMMKWKGKKWYDVQILKISGESCMCTNYIETACILISFTT